MVHRLHHLDIGLSSHLVPDNEGIIKVREFVQHLVDVAGIVRESLCLDAKWSVFKPSFPVRQTPKCHE